MVLTDEAIADVRAFLAKTPAPEDVLAYRVPEEMQRRVSKLLLKNNAGTISETELAELDRFMDLEHEFRMAKALARMSLSESS